MKSKPEQTSVVFRRWHSGGVCALFPYEAHDPNGIYCVSYEHQGQHGKADYDGMIRVHTTSVDKNDADVRDLIQELTGIGYDLKIITKASNAFEKRQAQTKAYRESAQPVKEKTREEKMQDRIKLVQWQQQGMRRKK